MEDRDGNEMLFLFWTEEDAEHAKQWLPLPEYPPSTDSICVFQFGRGKSHLASRVADLIVADESHQGLPTNATPNQSFLDNRNLGKFQPSNASKWVVFEIPIHVLRRLTSKLLDANVGEVCIPLRGARLEKDGAIQWTRMSLRHFVERELEDEGE
jgi:hypothetical protein